MRQRDSKASAEARLTGWKEIAGFFGRTDRTVKRWEKFRGLPVRRVPGATGGSVYAYEAELRDWLSGHPPDEKDGSPEASADTQRQARAWVPFLLAFFFCAAAALFYFAGGWPSEGSVAPASALSHDRQAVALYRTAEFEWQTRTPAGLGYAVKDFNAAITRDPKFARAYAGLADCYNLLREYTAMAPGEAYPRAEAAATRAIALDPTIGEAHAALAFDRFYWSRDRAGAQREFLIALSLIPKNADAHHWYATFLMTIGENARALVQIEQARSLDPTSPAILADKGLILFHARKSGEAAALLERLARVQPQFYSPHLYLTYIYLAAGRDRDLVRELMTAAEIRRDPDETAVADAAAAGYAAGGRAAMLRAILQAQIRLYAKNRISAYRLALAYANVHDEDNALAYLKLSLARHEPENVALGVDCSLVSLRARPGFRHLLSSAGLI